VANDARRVGSQFETDLVGYLRERGVRTERLARAGANDEGDLSIGDGAFIAEAKARRDRNSSLNLHAWLGEAEREAANYASARSQESVPTPILVVKNPRHKIEDSFVVLRLKDFIDEGS
jgi:Holliday junction resolvase